MDPAASDHRDGVGPDFDGLAVDLLRAGAASSPEQLVVVVAMRLPGLRPAAAPKLAPSAERTSSELVGVGSWSRTRSAGVGGDCAMRWHSTGAAQTPRPVLLLL